MKLYQRDNYFKHLWNNNIAVLLAFSCICAMFIGYWLINPDEDTPRTIKWTLIGNAVLYVVICGYQFFKWRKL